LHFFPQRYGFLSYYQTLNNLTADPKYDEALPFAHKLYGISEVSTIRFRYAANDTAKANKQMESSLNNIDSELAYYARLDEDRQNRLLSCRNCQ
jgi:hypothetical protein